MWSAGNRTRPRIGRGEVWTALLARQEAVRSGSGALSLVEGAVGVGKTTFLKLVSDRAQNVGFRVASTSAVPTEDPPPLQLVRAALRQVDLLRAPSSATPAPTHASVLFAPAFDGARTRYASTDPLGAMRDDARSEVASDRLRYMDTLVGAFLAAAEDGPLLVTLDDLHWADEASIAFLSQMLPRLTQHRVWILASASPPVGPSEPDALAPLRAHAGVERLALRPLNESEVGEFARWAVPHRRFRDEEIRRLHLQSDGVPERLEQLLTPPSSLTHLGRSTETPGERPPSLAEFSPDAQRVLSLAAVAGMEVTLELLANASGLTEERTVEHVERFIQRGLIREVEDGRFSFDREETRVRLCGEIGTRRLQLLHRRIAQALERSGSLDMATVYALARHTYLGGMDADALRYNQQAAAFAAGAFEPGLALFYLRHALEVLQSSAAGEHSTELQLRLAIAVQQVQLGDTDGAEESLREIRNSERLWVSTSTDDRALLSLYRARVLADQGRWDEAERSLTEMPEGFAREGPLPVRRAAMGLRGEILFYRGDYPEALAADEAALELAQQEGLRREVAAESIRRATALTMLPGRSQEALEEFRRAIAELVELGDFSEAAFGALCLGAQLNSQGRVEEARRELLRSVELAETAHDLRRSGWARLNLADLELGAGRLDDAAAHIRGSRESFEQVEDALGQARAALTEGRIAVLRGDLDLAQRDFELARSIFASRHLQADEIEVDLRRSELDLARHDEAHARERLHQLSETDLARLRPDLVDDWERLRRQLRAPDSAVG